MFKTSESTQVNPWDEAWEREKVKRARAALCGAVLDKPAKTGFVWQPPTTSLWVYPINRSPSSLWLVADALHLTYMNRSLLFSPNLFFVGVKCLESEIFRFGWDPCCVRSLSGIRELVWYCVSWQTPWATLDFGWCIYYSWSLAPRWLGIASKHPRLWVAAGSLWELWSCPQKGKYHLVEEWKVVERNSARAWHGRSLMTSTTET